MNTHNITKKHLSKLNVIIPLCMVIFIDTFAMTLIYPLFAPLFSLDTTSGGFFAENISLHIKNMLYGLTMAIYPIFMFFSSPLLGDLSDRIGRKKVLLVCLLGSSICAGLSGIATIAHSFVLFFIARMLAGTMAGSLPVAQAAITDISDEHDKTINVSLIGFAYTIGVVLGPVIGGFLTNKNIASWFGFSTPFFLTAALSICNAFILIFALHETLITVAQPINKKLRQIFKPLVMLLTAFKNKKLLNIIVACFFFVLAWNMYLSFVSLYLFQKYHLTAMQLGYFVGWIALIMSITMLLIIRVMIRYFTTVQILYQAILFSIAGGFICMLPGISIQWISAILIACGMGLTYSTIITLFSNAVAADLQGWIMGVSAATMASAAGVGGLLIGIVSINTTIAFISIIVIWALSFFFSLRIESKKTTTND